MPSRTPNSARSARKVTRRSTARRESFSSQASSSQTSNDITSSDKTPTGPAPRRSQGVTARQDYSQTTEAEDARMTEEELLADMSRHAIPSIYSAPEPSALKRSKVPARPAVVDLAEETPTTGDARRKRRRAVTVQDSSETVNQTGLVVLKMNPEKLTNLLASFRSRKRSSDHPILGLEALIGELGESDAKVARSVFDSVRSSLENKINVKGLADFLNNLFAPVKQRIAGKRARLSDDMAQVEREIRLFQEANGTP